MATTPAGNGFDHLDEAWLRSRPGAKWAVAGPDVIPCWIADMDFPAPLPVREALSKLVADGDLGYPSGRDIEALEAMWAARMGSRFGWAPEPGKSRLFSNLVQATEALLHVSTSPGEGVLVLTPCYPPFLESIAQMGRQLLPVQAIDTGSGWVFDLDAAKAAAASGNAKALLLVNPHNPTGRMLRRDELEALGELAELHDLVVISDEIHADLALTGATHVPFASLSEPLAARTVTLYSASKSYNLGGLCCALAHIGPGHVERELAAPPSQLLGHISTLAVAACRAAWSPEGDAWLEDCLARLRANHSLLAGWLAAEGAARVKCYPPEGTYLAWLDFRGAGLGDSPGPWLRREAKVLMNDGPDFGPGGAGFARLNFATTGDILAEVLDRVAVALAKARTER